MSYGTNPFAMGGWANPHNPASINDHPESRLYSNMPVGELQNSQGMSVNQFSGPRPSFVTYRFVQSSPPPLPGTPVNVLNSAVLDGRARPCFYITTNSHSGSQAPISTTSITDGSGAGVALVEWSLHPFAQLTNTFPRQLVSTIIQIRSSTTVAMVIRGRSYQWVRNPGEQQMYFYDASFNPPEILAIVGRDDLGSGMVVLNISPVALQYALLEAVIMSSALLLSGRTLD
ncbi:hypothetical protein DFP72DRAFT_1115699 [Ephemerocybe angulata]|uniref:Uncharacterized protein n=1 Tax=Ephemerocybe angulata TaxID=980116 RepID=A0A8H6M5S4_9AGAR|nr:hypothetical protein DFP72DRAFT_1149108 [Tulosesus angulatus]KAF6756768.1 hypothetical protein DFP72DRAFT_1115699 [Tulosesus angulatus]